MRGSGALLRWAFVALSLSAVLVSPAPSPSPSPPAGVPWLMTGFDPANSGSFRPDPTAPHQRIPTSGKLVRLSDHPNRNPIAGSILIAPKYGVVIVVEAGDSGPVLAYPLQSFSCASSTASVSSVWSASLSIAGSIPTGATLSPDQSRVYVSSDGTEHLIVLSTADGSMLTPIKLPPGFGNMRIAGDTAVLTGIGALASQLTVVDLAASRVKWQCAGPNTFAPAVLSADGKFVYTASDLGTLILPVSPGCNGTGSSCLTCPGARFNGSVSALGSPVSLDVTTQRMLFVTEYLIPPTLAAGLAALSVGIEPDRGFVAILHLFKTSSITTSIGVTTLDSGQVLAFAGDVHGVAYALDITHATATRTADVRWQAKVSDGQLVSTPVTDGNLVVFMSSGGDMAALDVANGTVVWKVALVGTSPMASAPISVDATGTIHVGDMGGQLMAFLPCGAASPSPEPSTIKWKLYTGVGVTVVGCVVIVACIAVVRRRMGRGDRPDVFVDYVDMSREDSPPFPATSRQYGTVTNTGGGGGSAPAGPAATPMSL